MKLLKTNVKKYSMKLRQHNLGNWIGGIIDAFNRVAFFITAINTIMIIAMFYGMTAGPWLVERLPWLTFPVFMSLAVFGIIVAMVLAYMFLLPSSMSFFNKHFYKHKNPMKRDLDLIKKKLGITDDTED